MSNHWFPIYPGDYLRDTAHLSCTEHGVYFLLLCHYYATGAPLPADIDGLCRICRASSKAEREAVNTVLDKFFAIQPDGLHNQRADRELVKRAEHHERLSNGARKTNEKRWGDYRPATRPATRPALASPQPQPQPQEKKKRAAQATPSLSFSGQHFSVTEKQDAMLGEAFPWVDRHAEYRKADSWMEANPDKRPKKANRFLHNWFSRITQPKEGGNGKLTGSALTDANLKAAGFVQ